jgi:SAM-dependent methyltransferase
MATPDLVDVDCPLCGSDQRRPLFQTCDFVLHATAQAFALCRCRNCGVGYLSPRPRPEDLQAFYPESYYWLHENASAPLTPDELLRIRAPQLRAKAACLAHLRPGRLLDIGAQKGEFLYFMSQQGWQAEGIEYSATPPNLFNMPIRYGELLDMDLPQAAYDCVTLWAVLEHVYQPREYLARIAHTLRPGGSLIGLVTNLNSVQARILRQDDYPRHLTVFTRSSLRRVLAEHGFRVRRFWTDQRIFGGSIRGAITYFVKRLLGCSPDELLTEWRDPTRPLAFCGQWRGRPSFWIKQVNRVDTLLLLPLDVILDRLGFGFLLTWEATYVGKNCARDG